LWFLSLAFGLISIQSEKQHYHTTHELVLNRTSLEKMADVTESLCFYVIKFFYPVHLCCIYPRYPILGNHLWIRYGATILFILALLVLAKITFFSKPSTNKSLLFCLWNFGIVAGPILGWFSTTYIKISCVSDRYNYHPLPFLIVFFALGIQKMIEKSKQTVKFVCFVIGGFLCIFLMILTFRQAMTWTTPLRLWSHCVRLNSSHEVPFYNLAMTYNKQGDLENARKALETSLQVNPEYNIALYEQGVLFYKQKNFPAAFRCFQEILHFPEGALYPLIKIKSKFKLGAIAEALKEDERAIQYYREILEEKNTEKNVYNRSLFCLALLLCKQKQYKEAQPYLLDLEKDDFRLADVYTALGYAYADTDLQKSEAYFLKALAQFEKRSDQEIVYWNLYILYQNTKQYAKSLSILEQFILTHSQDISW
ncbi:MAG: tetratricopeptide repeat protein, partial [Planctomycetota bacterium]